jgi:uncharacterized membrane protein
MEKIWEFLKKNKYEIVGICVWVFLAFLITIFIKDDFYIIGLLGLLGFPISILTILLFIIITFGGGFNNNIFNTIVGFGLYLIPIVFNGYLIGKIYYKLKIRREKND